MISSTDSGSHRLARILPATLLTFMVILSGTEPVLFGRLSVSLFISWAGVYYWSLFRAATLPYLFLFFVGLLQDVVMGVPVGLNPLILILMRIGITQFKHYLTVDHFWAIWTGFLLTALFFSCCAFCIVSFIEASWQPNQLGQWMFNSFLTWIIYPAVHLLFNRTYKLLPRLHSRHQSL